MSFYEALKTMINANIDNKNTDWQKKVFEKLHTKFSLISLMDGFGNSSFKAPIEKGWTRYCTEKNPNLPTSRDRCGICTGPASGLLVLDVDRFEAFKAYFEREHGIPPQFDTFIVETGRGYHIYFQYPDDGQEYTNKSFRENGFDIRGLGGQVVAPGSRHPETEKAYAIASDFEPIPAPQWLLDLCIKPASSEKSQPEEVKPSEPVSPLELAGKLEKLPSHIREMIAQGKPKGQRSEASMQVMLFLLSHGFTDEEIKNIYGSYPIGEKSREQGEGWFKRELESAKQHRQNSQQRKKTIYSCVKADDIIKSDIKQSFLIDTVLPKGGQLILHGKSGTFKTHLVLQLAIDLLHEDKERFLDTFPINREYSPRNILIINGENSVADMKAKMTMIEKSIDEEKVSAINKKILFMEKSGYITFTDTFDNPTFIQAISSQVKENSIDLVIIDNLQCFHTRVENENEQMRQVVNKMTELAVKHDLTLVLVHHSGKGDATELRGASSLKDWATNIIAIEESKGNYLLHNTKSRSSKKFEMVKLTFNESILTPCDTKERDEDIISIVMKQKGGFIDTKGNLIESIKKYCSENNINKSTVEIRKMIEEAVAVGKLIVKRGDANSYQYQLKE